MPHQHTDSLPKTHTHKQKNLLLPCYLKKKSICLSLSHFHSYKDTLSPASCTQKVVNLGMDTDLFEDNQFHRSKRRSSIHKYHGATKHTHLLGHNNGLIDTYENRYILILNESVSLLTLWSSCTTAETEFQSIELLLQVGNKAVRVLWLTKVLFPFLSISPPFHLFVQPLLARWVSIESPILNICETA